MKTIFVAGTDTGVGKTMISAAMAAAFRMQGYKVGVMKPVACGSWDDSRHLKEASGCTASLKEITPLYFKSPLAPTVAAFIEKKRISIRSVELAYRRLQKKADVMIVEGCGGLLVPLTDKLFVVDLILQLKADCILVSRSGLGAINHSLLSLEVLRTRKIPVLGVIFNRLSGGEWAIPEKTNPSVVAHFGHTRALGVFPHMKPGCAVNCSGKAFLKHIDLSKILC